jgi:AraC-like DNA-binding protein
MNITDHIIPIIFILGLIQGLIFSTILIYLNFKKDRSTLFLGIFILIYSINYVKPISKYLNLIENYPTIKDLPFNFSWLLFPLFYIYIRNISILPKSKKVYLYLIPGIIMFIIDNLIYFKTSTTLETIRNSSDFNFIHHIGGHLYAVFIFYKTYVFINNHITETNNQYSSTEYKELEWARTFMLIGIIFTLIIHFRPKGNNFYINLIISSINVGLLYWVCFYSLRQYTVKNLIVQKKTKFKKGNSNKLKSQITENDKSLFKKIEQLITLKKAYKNPELNIIDIANLTNQHPKKVSSVINTVSNKNFKSYINSFRIEEAKKILKSNNSYNFSIEGVSTEVGFKSKSAFYEAFKKETNTTPTNYRNQ